MARNEKRIVRLLSAQQKAHSIAAATAARARFAFSDAADEEARRLHNGSGENESIPAGVVHTLSNPARRSQQLAELSGRAEQLGEIANTERRLARQLERLVESRRISDRAKDEAQVLTEQLEAMMGQRMSSTTQVPSHNSYLIGNSKMTEINVKSANAGTTLAAQVTAGRTVEARSVEAQKTAAAFETTLLGVLFDQALPHSASAYGQGMAGEYARSQLCNELAHSVTLTGGIGVARMLELALKRNANAAE